MNNKIHTFKGELHLYNINGSDYLIPPKIYSKPFTLSDIHMCYRSDMRDSLQIGEQYEYPNILKESNRKLKGYDNDQLLMPITFEKMGKGHVGFALYQQGEQYPIRTERFKPWCVCSYSKHMVYGYDFTLKAGDYFLLLDNIVIDISDFLENETTYKCYGSSSFGAVRALDNGMTILPFHITSAI